MHPDSFSKLRQPTGQRLSNVRTQQTKMSIVTILFLYHEESRVSSNLNSKLLSFLGAHPNVEINYVLISFEELNSSINSSDSSDSSSSESSGDETSPSSGSSSSSSQSSDSNTDTESEIQ